MDRKKKILLILAFAIAAAVVLRLIWIYTPSDGMVIFQNEAVGVSIEEPLTQEEVVAAKKILWGKIPWPEAVYGYPACGFGRGYAITIDDTIYMMTWDSCGVLCVEDAISNTGPSFYMNISDADRGILQEIFDSRAAR